MQMWTSQSKEILRIFQQISPKSGTPSRYTQKITQECEAQIAQAQLARQAEYKEESASVLKAVMSKLERNKKEISKNLSDVKEELSQNRAL